MHKEKTYAKKLFPWIIIAIMAYTIADFALQYFTQVEISPTLTQMYFAFWCIEIFNITNIKINKVKAEAGIKNKGSKIIKDVVNDILSEEDAEEK